MELSSLRAMSTSSEADLRSPVTATEATRREQPRTLFICTNHRVHFATSIHGAGNNIQNVGLALHSSTTEFSKGIVPGKLRFPET